MRHRLLSKGRHQSLRSRVWGDEILAICGVASARSAATLLVASTFTKELT